MLQLQVKFLPYRDFLLNLWWERRRQEVVSAIVSWRIVPQLVQGATSPQGSLGHLLASTATSSTRRGTTIALVVHISLRRGRWCGKLFITPRP